MRRQKRIWIWIIAMALSFAACADAGGKGPRGQEREGEGRSSEGALGKRGDISGMEPESAESVRGSVVLEDDEAVYVCGNALIIGDRIYFVEGRQEKWEPRYGISSIRTDGTGYMRTEAYSSASPAYLFYADGVLYWDVCLRDDWFAYGGARQIRESGAPAEIMDVETPEGFSYIDSVPTTCTIQGSLRDHGYCLLEKDGEIVGWDPETGEATVILPEGSELKVLNKKRLLSERDGGLYLTDAYTLETVILTEWDGTARILEMDEDYLYTERPAAGEDVCIYEKISLEDGGRTELFREDMAVMRYAWDDLPAPPSEYMPVVVRGGYLYHVGCRDYKMVLMRRNLEDPSVERILGEAYYDRCVSSVGRLEISHEKIYSESRPDVILMEVYLENMAVDPKFPGADKINRVLREHGEGLCEEMADMAENDMHQIYEEGWWHEYFLSSRVESGHSDGERYLSFCQNDYAYWGGTHGMPYRTGYTFDLRTGERLALSDIIGNDGEELKEIVTAHYAESIEDGRGYWPDAMERVQEAIGFDMDFYLTGEGICLYFPPYELGGFAMGFAEVVIPYDEWELKIPLGKFSGEYGPTEASRLDYNRDQ